jgi:hypothetical protein
MISTGGADRSRSVRCCGFGVAAGHAEHSETASQERWTLSVGAAVFCLCHNESHSASDENWMRWSAQNTGIGNGVVAAAVAAGATGFWSTRAVSAQSGS